MLYTSAIIQFPDGTNYTIEVTKFVVEPMQYTQTARYEELDFGITLEGEAHAPNPKYVAPAPKTKKTAAQTQLEELQGDLDEF